MCDDFFLLWRGRTSIIEELHKVFDLQMSNEQNPGYLLYIGDEKLPN